MARQPYPQSFPGGTSGDQLPPDGQPGPEGPIIQPPSSWLARNRKFAILGGLLLILLATSVTLAYLRGRPGAMQGSANQVVEDTHAPLSNQSVGQTRPTSERFPVTAAVDADGDGLSDDQEQQLGTDRQATDTDHDGLNDYEEARVYQTKPRTADSDNDGHTDGQEVRTGHNPNGPGLSRDLPRAIQQLPKN